MNQIRQLPLWNVRPSFQNRDIKAVTFKGKFDYPIHRWFRLTPSFSPELVSDILDHWALSPDAQVLDPFCGVGTTPLVCQARGLRSCAVELNPLLHFVARVKTTPVRFPQDLTVAAREVITQAKRCFTSFDDQDTDAFLISLREAIPRIRNVTRWWSPTILKKLVALHLSLATASLADDQVSFLKLAAASILIEVSNALHNHPSLSFARVAREDAPVFERFLEQVQMMVDDLESFPQVRPQALILQGNSKYLEQVLPANSMFDAVITSPPYPNRYSYARETRPQMFYLGFIQDGREVGELEVEAIGGTWGKATSVLKDRLEYRSPAVKEALRSIPERIGRHSHLMQNYVIKYFNDIEQHLQSLRPFLRRGVPLAYVIGNSKFYKIDLPSDEVLADIVEANGFRVVSIERMRRRNSKSGLYEAVVFMEIPK